MIINIPKVWLDDLGICENARIFAFSDSENLLILTAGEILPYSRIHTYIAGRMAHIQLTIKLPSVWVENVHILPGDAIQLFRDHEDRLVIVKESA